MTLQSRNPCAIIYLYLLSSDRLGVVFMKRLVKVLFLVAMALPCWVLPTLHVESYEGMVLVFKDGTNYLLQGESEGYDRMRFIGRSLDVGHVRFNGRNWDIPTGKVPSVKTLRLKHGLNYLSGTPVRIRVVTSRYSGFLNAVAGMFFESSVGLGSVSVNVLSSNVLGSCYDTDMDDFESSRLFDARCFDGHDVEDIVYAE